MVFKSSPAVSFAIIIAFIITILTLVIYFIDTSISGGVTCENVQIEINGDLCYDARLNSYEINIKNTGDYRIRSLKLIINEDEVVELSGSSIRSGSTFSGNHRTSSRPSSFSIVPVIGQAEICHDKAISPPRTLC